MHLPRLLSSRALVVCNLNLTNSKMSLILFRLIGRLFTAVMLLRLCLAMIP